MTLTYMLADRHEWHSDEWHAARRNRLGGSEIAAVMGLSPYESKFSLWHRKMGFAGRKPQNPEMDWGNRLEPIVLDKFFEGEGRTRYGEAGATYVSKERPWQSATPDAFASVDARPELVEVKTSPFGEGWGPAGTDEIPIYYRCQVLWYLDVFGMDVCHVPVLISGCDYREYRIELDAEARLDIATMREAGREFIESLTLTQRPPIDDHDETYRVIRETHPDIEADEETDLGDLGLDYLLTKEALAGVERAHKTVRALVLDAMGSANYGTYMGERIVRRQAKGDGVPFLASTRRDPRGKAATLIRSAS